MVDEEEIYIHEELAKRQQQDREEALSFVLSDPRGRAFVWEILGQTGLFGASFTGDQLTTAFNEGKRHIGIGMFAEAISMRPAVFGEMQAENATRVLRYHVMTNTQRGEDHE